MPSLGSTDTEERSERKLNTIQPVTLVSNHLCSYTVRGNWGYHEYDWVGKPGDYVTEVPGTIHTLYMGEQSEVMFNVVGSIEFYNDDNTLREIMDGFSFWRMYEEHCEKKGVKPNKGLWY